jgi:hypothetical protein
VQGDDDPVELTGGFVSPEYLLPLDEAFFSRGRTLHESIRDHLLLLFRGEVSFAADPEYACNLEEWVRAENPSLLAENLQRCLPKCDPRIRRVEVEKFSLDRGHCKLVLRLTLAPEGADELGLEADVQTAPFAVTLRRAA